MVAQMLEFINNLSIEDRLFWQLGHDKGHAYEIDWKRSERPRPWSLRLIGQKEAQSYNTSELLQALTVLGIDLQEFERQVGVSILTQAVFADMVTSAAKQLFGDEVVARSVNDTRTFLNSISAMAAEHATPLKKSRLKLVPPNSV